MASASAEAISFPRAFEVRPSSNPRSVVSLHRLWLRRRHFFVSDSPAPRGRTGAGRKKTSGLGGSNGIVEVLWGNFIRDLGHRIGATDRFPKPSCGAG